MFTEMPGYTSSYSLEKYTIWDTNFGEKEKEYYFMYINFEFTCSLQHRAAEFFGSFNLSRIIAELVT